MLFVVFFNDEFKVDLDVVDGCEGGVRWDISECYIDERWEGVKCVLDLELVLVFVFIWLFDCMVMVSGVVGVGVVLLIFFVGMLGNWCKIWGKCFVYCVEDWRFCCKVFMLFCGMWEIKGEWLWVVSCRL